MAEDTTHDPTTDTEEKKHTKQQRMLIIIGVVSLVLVYVMMKRSSSSGAAQQSDAQQNALAQWESQMAAQNPYGAGSPMYAPGMGYSLASDPVAQQMLGALQQIQGEVSTMTPSGAGASATVAPSAQPSYLPITDPQVGSVLTAENVPVFVKMPQGPIVPFQSGINYPKGSQEVYQA